MEQKDEKISVKKAMIYTKTGDKGQTSLVGGARVPKTHPRLEAYGTLDELNSILGLLRSEIAPTNAAQKNLQMVQNNLFNIGSHLACEDEKMLSQLPGLSAGAIANLESDMDQWENTLPPLRQFILPGGTRASSVAHLARSVCRRGERKMLTVGAGDEQLIFINRLSDWLFLLARQLNSDAGTPDVPWQKG
jgi:cob(I)alamin adenosyltransferase